MDKAVRRPPAALLLSSLAKGFIGTLYRGDPSTFQPTILHHFTNGADGGLPRGELVLVPSTVGGAERTRSFFSAGPNPTTGPVTLRCDPSSLPAQAQITDVLGRVSHAINITRSNTTFDLGDVFGVRCITLTGANGHHTERLVVER